MPFVPLRIESASCRGPSYRSPWLFGGFSPSRRYGQGERLSFLVVVVAVEILPRESFPRNSWTVAAENCDFDLFMGKPFLPISSPTESVECPPRLNNMLRLRHSSQP